MLRFAILDWQEPSRIGRPAHDDDVTLKDAIFAKVGHTDEHDQELNSAMDRLKVEEKKEEPANKRKELTKRLLKAKEQCKNMKRELTGHVVTLLSSRVDPPREELRPSN